MKFYSTNNKNLKVDLKQAVTQGLAPDNGLYMPELIPALPASFIEQMPTMSFQEIAFSVASHLLHEDVSKEELRRITTHTIAFDAPLVSIEENIFALELFHGPTMAFKDFGARFMSQLLGYFARKQSREIVVLVATSGDTGSAVANGFLGVDGVRVVVLYPSGKVSDVQERQFTTLGQNITALEVDGTFDDCQALVKKAFLDSELQHKFFLTSANSINIARLIPQSFYYFYAYSKLATKNRPVVRQSDAAKALNALHESFFLSDRKLLNVFLVGTGLIGNSLVNMIDDQFNTLAKDNLLEISVVGVANSKKMLFNEEGHNRKNCIETMKASGEMMDMRAFVEKMISLNLPNSIFVDCTSSEQVTAFYEQILDANISIVTPNKKANSASMDQYRQLKKVAFKRSVKFLYETNVGAGLPVINTLNDLLLSGDKVISIEGVLSGTLNFIFSSFAEGKKFSDVVKEAKAKGYTEPDPRDDLSGMDVARKILILSRETGLPFELTDITVENLVPKDCQGDTSVDQFFKDLEKHDAAFEKLRVSAAAKNEKLRYMAVLNRGKIQVSLGSVDDQHPFYSLSGSDNIILLTTERYHDRPMVIRGPGAGAAVTAAGVFADIIRIGHYAR